MNTLLIEDITPEKRENYYLGLIEKDLALPFHPRIHQQMLLNLKNVEKNSVNRLKIQMKIWEKFYGERE